MHLGDGRLLGHVLWPRLLDGRRPLMEDNRLEKARIAVRAATVRLLAAGGRWKDAQDEVARVQAEFYRESDLYAEALGELTALQAEED